ncbi:urease accessory UreF family protein [Metallosphaera hakonensis]|uniref:urease accessory UreF family protein n=1 Tax=Metallosphaera hakonensis TaxID=79601 RepID=UPI000A633187|nr:urease accessory UreF family protein [Metallosphaera hakonensis]
MRKGEKGAYPIVVARCCVSLGIEEEICLSGLAYSELAQMVFSAVRLGALDFQEGQRFLFEVSGEVSLSESFEPFSPVLDVLSIKHETREPKVFMS